MNVRRVAFAFAFGAVVTLACTASPVCPSGRVACGDACVDTSSDIAHCGSCGVACAGGDACVQGTCTPPIKCPNTICAGLCVDLATDPSNCGSCGAPCASSYACVGGACALTCTGATTSCGGKCVDTKTDTKNCGGCGHACLTTEICVNGSCLQNGCVTDGNPCSFDVDCCSNFCAPNGLCGT